MTSATWIASTLVPVSLEHCSEKNFRDSSVYSPSRPEIVPSLLQAIVIQVYNGSNCFAVGRLRWTCHNLGSAFDVVPSFRR